jgi:hypothetical protein
VVSLASVTFPCLGCNHQNPRALKKSRNDIAKDLRCKKDSANAASRSVRPVRTRTCAIQSQHACDRTFPRHLALSSPPRQLAIGVNGENFWDRALANGHLTADNEVPYVNGDVAGPAASTTMTSTMASKCLEFDEEDTYLRRAMDRDTISCTLSLSKLYMSCLY